MEIVCTSLVKVVFLEYRISYVIHVWIHFVTTAKRKMEGICFPFVILAKRTIVLVATKLDIVTSVDTAFASNVTVKNIAGHVKTSFVRIVDHLINAPVTIKCFVVTVPGSPCTPANGKGVERYSV